MSTSKILVSEREICLWFIAARLPVKEIGYNEKRPGTETKDSTALTHVLLLFFSFSFFLFLSCLLTLFEIERIGRVGE